jgi:hypothetical protein
MNIFCVIHKNLSLNIRNLMSIQVIHVSMYLENHRPVASHRQTLSHDVVSSTSHEQGSNSQI